ncbi:uncharacterized protein LOC103708101 isoform X2 [Phoenix dactylifera]|uniref:Uncharacterized protein LOC103708101 isoform X2 n=1 Tax=Phoenix dactylifera TaxID=42345 RepID=A0A8B7C3R9_PHODC|nr:uncharacterized protein LOC103708101 isoform X2 [Phoenix dactylifera]
MRLLGSPPPSRRRHHRLRLARFLLLLGAAFTALLLLWISTQSVHPSDDLRRVPFDAAGDDPDDLLVQPSLLGAQDDGPGYREEEEDKAEVEEEEEAVVEEKVESGDRRPSCASVEKMGEVFAGGSERESLRVREIIKRHFDLHGAARVRELPPHQFCRQGFVIGKASEAGFGNEMYKILTAAALSVMLNRSLIIGQTRGLYPFGDYVSYTNLSFTLKEVKHLWRKNDCARKYGRDLIMRVDNFEHPTETNVLCSNWRAWKHPIIWFQGTTDAVAVQFFLKNIHPIMKNAASVLFGRPESLQSRPNVFGELMRVIISPSQVVKEAVNWVTRGADPDVALHMRMLTNRSVRATKAAVWCIKRALNSYQNRSARPRVVLVSDTPSFIKEITPDLTEFAEVLHFNYKLFEGNISSGGMNRKHQSLDFRVRDWGPAPRWVAFVDFFLASRARHAVVSGAHRRVGTTYAQLIAALAAANRYGENLSGSSFSFFSSFHSNLLVAGLKNQIGWGHIWNRFAGPSSCHHQPHQCAFTPLLPPAWWDGEWQSPIPRDIRRLEAYGVKLTDTGKVDESSLQTFCKSRKGHVKTLQIFGQCKNSKCA